VITATDGARVAHVATTTRAWQRPHTFFVVHSIAGDVCNVLPKPPNGDIIWLARNLTTRIWKPEMSNVINRSLPAAKHLLDIHPVEAGGGILSIP
jgi:hypothetical protein